VDCNKGSVDGERVKEFGGWSGSVIAENASGARGDIVLDKFVHMHLKPILHANADVYTKNHVLF
jgi:hypothetical protein